MTITPVPFATLSPADKRRAIARDVLERLRNHRIRPATGNWLMICTATEETNLQTLLADPETPACVVCALGGAVVGMAALENTIYTRRGSRDYAPATQELDLGMDTALSHRLLDLFGLHQLVLIETCFEHDGSAFCQRIARQECPLSDEERYAAERFVRLYRAEPSQRFRLIWEAIERDAEGMLTLAAIQAMSVGNP